MPERAHPHARGSRDHLRLVDGARPPTLPRGCPLTDAQMRRVLAPLLPLGDEFDPAPIDELLGAPVYLDAPRRQVVIPFGPGAGTLRMDLDHPALKGTRMRARALAALAEAGHG